MIIVVGIGDTYYDIAKAIKNDEVYSEKNLLILSLFVAIFWLLSVCS